MELLESENMKLNFQSEFACEMTETAKHSGWQFKSQFASDLDSLHNSLVISDCQDGGTGAAVNEFNESKNRDFSYLQDDHQSEQVSYF